MSIWVCSLGALLGIVFYGGAIFFSLIHNENKKIVLTSVDFFWPQNEKTTIKNQRQSKNTKSKKNKTGKKLEVPFNCFRLFS